jgi:hypothetical protein
VIKAKFEIYEWQRATASGVFVNAPLPEASLVVSNVDPTVMDRDQDEERWRVYTVLHKDTTCSGVFAPRHCQWRAAIRRFQNLLLSILLLII